MCSLSNRSFVIKKSESVLHVDWTCEVFVEWYSPVNKNGKREKKIKKINGLKGVEMGLKKTMTVCM